MSDRTFTSPSPANGTANNLTIPKERPSDTDAGDSGSIISTHSHLRFHPSSVRQPLPFFYPTGGQFVDSKHGTSYKWSSRSSRKNRSPPARHHIEPHPTSPHHGPTPRLTSTASSLEARLHKSPFKPHLEADCSFWVAVIFTAGSAVWVANGFLVFLPLLRPEVPQYTNAAGALAFVGGTLFEIGSWLMLVEAGNTGHEQMFEGPLSAYLRWRRPSEERLLESQGHSPHSEDPNDSQDAVPEKPGQKPPASKKFKWFARPAWRDIGYLASFIQLIAATVFWVSTIVGLPGVIPTLFTDPPVVVTDIFYWTPQVVGGFGFVVSSLLLMIETQKHWYLPNPLSIGWQVGFWNLVGALGFLLCGAFGYLSLDVEWENYQSACSTFWGSWAFLIGSLVQLWETLWREEPQ